MRNLQVKIYKKQKFLKSDLSKSVFNNCKFNQCNFWETKLTNSKFVNAEINDSVFSDAKLNNTKFSACNKNRIQKLFRVNQSTKLISIHEGMLIPPVGRFISSNLNPSYFIVAKLFPFLIGQVGYILKKI